MEEKKRNKKPLKPFSGLLAEMAKYGDDQNSIADLLGLGSSAVSRRFSGEVEWSIGEVDIICYYYGKSYYELFTNGEG